MDKETIFRAIIQEREAQDEKWGVQNNTWAEWIAILTEEVGETSQEALKLTFGGFSPERLVRYVDETIQVAAVAVAMLEYLDTTTASRTPE